MKVTKKLRLLVTKVCDRRCPGCCNKDYDLDNLPKITDFHGWDEIMITGGEPLLFPEQLRKFVKELDSVKDNETKLYLYTASMNLITNWEWIITWFDGVQLTIHDLSQEEIDYFNNTVLLHRRFTLPRTLRLSVFPELKYPILIRPKLWDVVRFQGWIEKCPLPAGETLGRPPILFEEGAWK